MLLLCYGTVIFTTMLKTLLNDHIWLHHLSVSLRLAWITALQINAQQVISGPKKSMVLCQPVTQQHCLDFLLVQKYLYYTSWRVWPSRVLGEESSGWKGGRVEPDRDTGVTLWHVQIPSTELCLAQQHETRKWATNLFLTPHSQPLKRLHTEQYTNLPKPIVTIIQQLWHHV